MDQAALQRRLATLGYYHGAIDGAFEDKSKAALLTCLTDGPDYAINAGDIAMAAKDLAVEPAKVWAVYDVEAAGDAFIDGRPAILFEPHRFSRSTDHRYDASHPRLSSRTWNRKLYPGSQDGRWRQLLDAVALDVDAGFMSASYGAFQILGENFDVCGAPDAWSFAWRQSRTEGDQLDAFIAFVAGRGLKRALQAISADPATCKPFADGYNGTASALNRYAEKIAAAYAKRWAA
ncbi:DUF3380 domain-containing protein [Sphingobium sp. LMC3-1-1.1]|uniref:N-acetylmuramidase domain-containing protein n=1 Tax=Sphingobium sp. LMC3-1-1.1 TaxID=3135241 RepID=UPI00344428B1